jgi:parallel beta-helix repeat protein
MTTKKLFSILLILVSFSVQAQLVRAVIGQNNSATGGESIPTGADYYVSTSGTGTGDGSIGDPLDFTQLQALTPVAGDTIALKGGDEFYGSLTLSGVNGTVGNPITFTSYGTGKATIKGSESITGWANEGGNIWSADVTGKTIYNVFSNGVPANNTRTPLPNMYTIDTKTSNTVFICNELAGVGYPDIVGATVYTESNQWTMQNRTVTAFNATTGEITLSGAETISEGNLFTIHNHKNLLSSQDDWAYDSLANKLYVYSTTSPTNVTATTSNTNGISIATSSYVTIDGLEVKHFSNYGISFSGSNNLVFDNNYIHDCNLRGISEASYNNTNTYITVTNNQIEKMDEHAIRIYGQNSVIEDNVISNVGMQDYKTWTNSGYTTAIYSNSDDGTIKRNSIENTGYNAINFSGQRTIIDKNYVENTNIYLPDGGAIYTYSTDFTDTTGDDSEITDNTVINPVPARFRESIGLIYLDDRSKGQTVSGNTTEGGKRGIFLHNTRNVTVLNNTVHAPAQDGIGISEDANGGSGNTYGNVLTGNKVLVADSEYPVSAIGVASSYGSTGMYTGSNNEYYNIGFSHPVLFRNTSTYFLNSNYPKPLTVSELQTLISSESGTTSNSSYDNEQFSLATQGAEIYTNTNFASGISPWNATGSGALVTWNASGYLEFDPNGNANAMVAANDLRVNATEGQVYLVQFDVKGTTPHWGRFNFQMTGSPYKSAGIRPFWITSSWMTHKYLIRITDTGNDYRSEWRNENDSVNGFELDNVSLTLVTESTKPQNTFLAYNETSVAKDIALPAGTWDSVDGTQTNKTGTVTVPAYNSYIMIKQ